MMTAIALGLIFSAAWDLLRWKRYVSSSVEILGGGDEAERLAAQYCQISVLARVSLGYAFSVVAA